MPVPGKLSTRALTKHLNFLGAQVFNVLPDGTQVTREEALAELLWNMALGYTEEIRNDEGTLEKVIHKPVAWAIQYIYDRKEGRTAPTILEDENRVRAADRVRELSKERLNKLAASVAAPAPAPEKKGPPTFKPKRKDQ